MSKMHSSVIGSCVFFESVKGKLCREQTLDQRIAVKECEGASTELCHLYR